MSYHEGQIVKCISSKFPQIATTSDDKEPIGKQPEKHPVVGDYYQISEILGDFLSFGYFNEDEICWWHQSRFRLATLEELEGFGLLKIAKGIGSEGGQQE